MRVNGVFSTFVPMCLGFRGDGASMEELDKLHFQKSADRLSFC